MQGWIQQQCDSLGQAASIWAWPCVLMPLVVSSVLLYGLCAHWHYSAGRKASSRYWGERRSMRR